MVLRLDPQHLRNGLDVPLGRALGRIGDADIAAA
jgi:hypothetical protein